MSVIVTNDDTRRLTEETNAATFSPRTECCTSAWDVPVASCINAGANAYPTSLPTNNPAATTRDASAVVPPTTRNKRYGSTDRSAYAAIKSATTLHTAATNTEVPHPSFERS